MLLRLLMVVTLVAMSCPARAELPRTHDGKPDLNGIWQALGAAHVNVEPHPATAGPRHNDDALAAERGGLGIVQGGTIPYLEGARQHQRANYADRENLDPVRKCYMPGIPRANYMPHPIQIVQTPQHLFFAYEFAQASRTIYIDRPDFEAPVDTWMGHSIGRWDGDTLIVDVSAQVPDTWLDRAGNHHSGALQVEERYTLLGPHHLRYEATLTDPQTYERPWTLSTILYKNMQPNAQLLDFKCIEFVEELMYGELSKNPSDQPAEADHE